MLANSREDAGWSFITYFWAFLRLLTKPHTIWQSMTIITLGWAIFVSSFGFCRVSNWATEIFSGMKIAHDTSNSNWISHGDLMCPTYKVTAHNYRCFSFLFVFATMSKFSTIRDLWFSKLVLNNKPVLKLVLETNWIYLQ